MMALVRGSAPSEPTQGPPGVAPWPAFSLRAAGSQWLRGLVRTELMHDAQVLLDSGRLRAAQRSRVAQTLLRRLDSLDLLRDHW